MTAQSPATTRFRHRALFYRGDDQYLAAVVPFVRDGADADEPIAVAVPAARLTLLRDALGVAQRRVRWFDMSVVGRNPGRIIPGVLRAFADSHRYTHVRIVGESIWPGRTPVEYPACAQHEALVNEAFAERDVTILCPYDAAELDPAVLADAAMTHPVLVGDHGERPSAHFAPDAVVARYNQPLPPADGAAVCPVDADSLALARLFATEHAARQGMSADRLPWLAMAANELVETVAGASGASGMLGVWADGDGQVVIEVAGPADRLFDPMAGRVPADAAHPDDCGLLLVNHLADLVRIRHADGLLTVRAYFRR